MKANLRGYRITILSGICLLVILLALMVSNLLTQLRELSVANEDNMQWSITQIDTEFANLNAALSKQLSDGTYTDAQIKLRLDIAISRLFSVNSGRGSALFASDPEAQILIASLNEFATRAVSIVDVAPPLSSSDLVQLRSLTEDILPNVRKIALLGLKKSIDRAEASRLDFSKQLRRTGSIAIILLILMAAMMLFLGRLLSRAALRDSELLTAAQLLKSTVAASLDAIITANEKGQIIEYNDAAQSVFGWTRDEIINKTMEETFMPHRLRDAHTAGMKRYLKTQKPRIIDGGRIELPALRKSGEEFPVELNLTSIKDDEGTKFIAYIRDISDRIINEQKLIDARDRAERTDKAKSHFLTVMSHEMRTPLNGILGVLDLLRTTTPTDPQTRYIDIATASSEILLEHINEALDITRIETGTLQITPQDFDLPALVSSIVSVLEPLAHEKHVELNLLLDDAMPVGFHGDSGRLRQILINLIGNAIKFTDTGSIQLKVSGVHGPGISSVKFAVSDTGVGIKPENQEQIFEGFVALAYGEGRQTRGDGLGLSISRKIARQLGGDLNVTSEAGVGSTFTLTIPLQRKTTRLETAPEAKEVPPALSVSGHKILVVEDNDINRKVLRDMLLGMGHTVTEAINGAECLKLARTNRYDLIFMDISMPVMDGIEATQRLRTENGLNQETLIVGLTAHGKEEYREDASNAGMNRFHTKPIRMDALSAILNDTSAKTSNDIQSGVIRELCTVLGVEKAQEIGAKLFAELEAFIADIRSETVHAQTPELVDSAHKMNGASALLGLRTLGAALAELEQLARSGGIEDLAQRADNLEQLAELAHAQCKSVMSSFPS